MCLLTKKRIIFLNALGHNHCFTRIISFSADCTPTLLTLPPLGKIGEGPLAEQEEWSHGTGLSNLPPT